MLIPSPIFRRLDELRELFDDEDDDRPSQPELVAALIQAAEASVQELRKQLGVYKRAYPKDTLLGETGTEGVIELPKPPRAK